MKKISTIILAVVLVIIASLNASAQTEQTRQVSGFTGITAAGPFNVHVKMGNTETLKLSAESNVINDIETVVEGDKLEIRFKREKEWYSYNGKIEVYITAKSLSALSISGSGDIIVDGVLNSPEVKFTVSGSGRITTAVKSTDFNATITGSGKMTVNGSTENAHLIVTGSGNYDAKELKIGTASVTLTGSGNAHIFADKTITAQITGAGHLVYSGNASVTDIRTAGAGRVTKEN